MYWRFPDLTVDGVSLLFCKSFVNFNINVAQCILFIESQSLLWHSQTRKFDQAFPLICHYCDHLLIKMNHILISNSEFDHVKNPRAVHSSEAETEWSLFSSSEIPRIWVSSHLYIYIAYFMFALFIFFISSRKKKDKILHHLSKRSVWIFHCIQSPHMYDHISDIITENHI